jgi:hypothetical protein
MSGETIAIIGTILVQAVGVTAWITSQLTALKTEVKHAFQRITALETRTVEAPVARARQRKR